MERLPLTLRTALCSRVSIQMCGFLYEQRMGEVQLAVIVTRIQVRVLWDTVTKKTPKNQNPTGSLQWSELKLALLGGGGRVFLTWIVWVTQFKHSHAAARWRGQWVQRVGGSDALNGGTGEGAVSRVTAGAGVLFLILWKLVEKPGKR